MKAGELRIGNYVHMDMSIDDIEVIRLRIGDLASFAIEARELYPIQLTEEWLLKFGFIEVKRHTHDFEEVFYGKSIIKDSPNHYEQLVISLPLGNIEIGEFNIEESYLMNIDMKYVHQLQNLYFALTNEELHETNTK